MTTVGQVHDDVLTHGFAVVPGRSLGLDADAFMREFSSALAPDPRGPGKLHARDVLSYDRAAGKIAECDSIAHGDVDDFSRFRWMNGPAGVRITATGILALVPAMLRHGAGRMSADYFRYSAGVESPPHRDVFGDVVVIWCLGREGGGAENYLIRDKDMVFHRALDPGEVLVFCDDLFLHGITPLLGEGAWRDVLVCIMLRDPA